MTRFKQKYQNKWVALDPKTGGVLGSDKDLAKLAVVVKDTRKDYTLEKVLPLEGVFIP